MITTVEIDKAGRVVVPKKVRNALHVRAGDRFEVEGTEDGIFLRPLHPEVRLEERDGLLVIVGGPPIANDDVVELIDEQRERRTRYVSGLSDEP